MRFLPVSILRQRGKAYLIDHTFRCMFALDERAVEIMCNKLTFEKDLEFWMAIAVWF